VNDRRRRHSSGAAKRRRSCANLRRAATRGLPCAPDGRFQFSNSRCRHSGARAIASEPGIQIGMRTFPDSGSALRASRNDAHVSSPVLFVEAPGSPSFFLNPRSERVWRAKRRCRTPTVRAFTANQRRTRGAYRRATSGDFCLRVRVSWDEATGPVPVQRAPRRGAVVPPDRVPKPPGSGVTSPARRRRTADAGLARYRPNQGGSIIETSRDDALK
jgi:hypothetical protein